MGGLPPSVVTFCFLLPLSPSALCCAVLRSAPQLTSASRRRTYCSAEPDRSSSPTRADHPSGRCPTHHAFSRRSHSPRSALACDVFSSRPRFKRLRFCCLLPPPCLYLFGHSCGIWARKGKMMRRDIPCVNGGISGIGYKKGRIGKIFSVLFRFSFVGASAYRLVFFSFLLLFLFCLLTLTSPLFLPTPKLISGLSLPLSQVGEHRSYRAVQSSSPSPIFVSYFFLAVSTPCTHTHTTEFGQAPRGLVLAMLGAGLDPGC